MDTAPAYPASLLVIDDVSANAAVILENLITNGYWAVAAKDGQQALQYTHFVQFDLILLDVMMPGMDGFEVCRCLKENPKTADIPVIFMTSLTDTQHKVTGFNKGGVDYITKPIQIDELLARVATHLKIRLMQQQLQHQQIALEHRVAQRTAELTAKNLLLRKEISQRKQAQERLALLDFALNQASEAVYLIDENRCFLYVNEEASRTLGYGREALLGMNAADAGAAWLELISSELWCKLKSQGSLRLEMKHPVHNAPPFPAEFIGNYFEYYGAGYMLARVRDISEHKRQEALNQSRYQIFELLAQGGELPELLKQVINYVEQVFPDCAASIMLPNAKGTRMELVVTPDLSTGCPIADNPVIADDDARFCCAALRTQTTVITEDIRCRPDASSCEHLLKAGLLSCSSMPILDFSDNALGVLSLYRKQADSPDSHELEQLHYASYLASIAIQRKRMEERLLAREREFRSLAENLPQLIVRYDRDCRRIYSNPACKRETDVPLAAILNKTIDEIEESFTLANQYWCWVKRVIETGESSSILLEWRDHNNALVSHKMHGVAEFDEQGRVIGALVIGHNITEIKSTERRLEKSQSQLRILAAKRDKDREEERKRIAREIHDELGQLLSVLRLSATMLDIRFSPANAELHERALKMVEIIDRSILVMRGLVTRLRPSTLNSGIVPALEWLAQELDDCSDIACYLHLPTGETIELDEDRAMMVFRIAQESLTNVLRHSGADRVDITLRSIAEIVELEISDNGKGIDWANIKSDSFGIIGMQERALMLKGELTIFDADNGGTKLVLRIPINDAEPLDGGNAQPT